MKLKVRWVAESSRVFSYSSFLPFTAHPSASQMLAKPTATLSILLTPELCQRRRVFQVYVGSVSAPRCELYRVIGWSATEVRKGWLHFVTGCCLGGRRQLAPGFVRHQFSAHVLLFRLWRGRCSVRATAWQPKNRGSIRDKGQEIYVFCKRSDCVSDPPSLLLLGTGALGKGIHWPAQETYLSLLFNLLKPNDIHICRTAAPTSRRYILNIYSTNIHTEYFKHAA